MTCYNCYMCYFRSNSAEKWQKGVADAPPDLLHICYIAGTRNVAGNPDYEIRTTHHAIRNTQQLYIGAM